MTEPESTEIWKPVRGYEGLYEVSDQGRVRRVPSRGRWGNKTMRVLNGCVGKVGYRVVALCNGRVQRQVCVHRLVVEAFIGTIPKGMTVNHLDADKLNNRVENLEIATYLRQSQHTISLGRGRWQKGEEAHAAKLTEADVKAMRARYVKGSHANGAYALAREFGVSGSAARGVVERKTWRHI